MKTVKKLIVISLCAIGANAYAQEAPIGTMGRISNHAPEDTFTSGLYASKDTYGMRASAIALAVRANPDKPFDYPVNGFAWTKSLSGYSNRDSVGLYADNTSSPFRSWEIINKANYTPTSFSSPQIDTSKIRPGMLIDTDHEPKWSAFVVAVRAGKVITDGWVNNKTRKMGTPSNGVGLKINPTSKIWAANFNNFYAENGRAKSGVIQENGIINNAVENPNEINGIDTTILPASKHGGTAAFLARSATSGYKQQWSLGFASQGAKEANFYSYNGSKTNETEAGFMDNSAAKVGMVFSGKNKNSSVEFYSSGRLVTKISPDGQVERISYKTKIIKESGQLSDMYARYIIKASSDVDLKLPSQKKLNDGYTLEVDNFTGNKIAFSGDAKINVANGIGRKMTATLVDGEWQVF
ncbi:hypothetical protein ACL2XP_17835 [Sodalis sp. RH21]|uniref:hypothetical protein n=1 Tax=unclassified Sodalis (in: enterobacteria) TaxID=2636512 RepID=UPI0039B4A269